MWAIELPSNSTISQALPQRQTRENGAQLIGLVSLAFISTSSVKETIKL